jgi:hypothetical protein
VDEFRPVHDLDSLARLAEALGPVPAGTRRPAPRRARGASGA